MLSRRQRHRLLFVGLLLVSAALGCADAPPTVTSAEARAGDDSLRLGLRSRLEPLLAAMPTDPSCDQSSSECPKVVSVSPGYDQGFAQPLPIEITFGGPVLHIAVVGQGAIFCLGTFGTLVGYGADGTELGRADLQLIDWFDCSRDNITFGAQATLQTTSPIARAVILPMSPLNNPDANRGGVASATYTVTYGAGVPPEADPPCDPSSGLCPKLVGVSPGYVQGADQPAPIELTFTGQVGKVKVHGRGYFSCLGTFGKIVGYDAGGKRIGSADLRLTVPPAGAPSNGCETGGNVGFSVEGTLRLQLPIARAVIEPMSPLTFQDGNSVVRAHATYTVTYGLGSLPAPPPPPPTTVTITAPPDVAVNTDPGLCTAFVDPGTATATGGAWVIGTRPDQAISSSDMRGTYPKGVTTITWTLTSENPAAPTTAPATQRVTVSDKQPPSVSRPPNITANNDPGLATAVVNPGVARAKDNCPGVTVAGARADGLALNDPYPLGTTVITWTATDASGNTASVTQTVKVIDALALQKLSAPSSIVEGSGYTVSISGPQPVGDRGPLLYALDCGLGEGYGAWSSVKSVVCPVQRDQRPEPITVRGKARDALGYEREITRQVAVKNAKPVVTFVATSATMINVGETVSFQGAFTDKGLDDGPWTWSVSWGDFTPAAKGTTSVQGDVGQFSHAYAKPGTFGAYLKVVDKDGAASVVKKVTVTVVQPAPAP